MDFFSKEIAGIILIFLLFVFGIALLGSFILNIIELKIIALFVFTGYCFYLGRIIKQKELKK